MRCFACLDEAQMVAQQISVRLTNGWSLGDEVTRRDIEILRHCEGLARPFGVALVAAVEEWASARKTAGPIPLADAVRFYQVNRTDLLPSMGHTLRTGNNVTINLEPDDLATTTRLFEALSDGGTDVSGLDRMFWGSYWGTCCDRYGVRWMFNCADPAD